MTEHTINKIFPFKFSNPVLETHADFNIKWYGFKITQRHVGGYAADRSVWTMVQEIHGPIYTCHQACPFQSKIIWEETWEAKLV